MSDIDCEVQSEPPVLIYCENDTLTVTWSTDLTYDGSVTQIPDRLYQRLTDRLQFESTHPILRLVVINRQPP